MNRISPVPDGLISARFDVALSKMLGISRAKAGVLIGNGEVSVIGRTADKSTKLMVTDMLSIDIEEHAAPEEPESHQMEILYEDDDVVVVDKPVGVAAHASVGWSGPTVLGSLLKRGVRITSLGAENRRGIVSRLDVGTSGVMLVCKSDIAYIEMRKQFSQHEVVKIYHAVAQGSLQQNKATIDAPIGRDRGADFRFTVTPAGKPAITHYDVLERFPDATLVKVNLETGRTHQIRVHFSSIGHPLVGDPLYGANPRLSERVGLQRQWLHAMSLEFKHPRTRLWTTVTSHYPQDLQRGLEILRSSEVQPQNESPLSH
jgi:23S rRNA pseudouridine1911/1915/1917 synthase